LLSHFSALARDQGRAIVMSLHDVNLAARFCGQVLMLFGDGEVLYGPISETLTAANLSRLYRTAVIPVSWPGGTVYLPG
jgi:iron complex transport system ATP-binding protein